MVLEIIRDSTAGQLLNFMSNGRLLPYADQRADFVVPPSFLPKKREPFSMNDAEGHSSDAALERGSQTSITQTNRDPTVVNHSLDSKTSTADPFLVDWYGDDDLENPRNWSAPKRAFVAFSISFFNFSVYIGSAIYTPSIPGIMDEFNVSLTHATLGLTLYIIGYGIGPMLLCPLQEMPVCGRNSIYILTLFLFVILQIPIITATNISTILVCRFLTGFFGSPALATGGATMSDIYPPHQLAYVIGTWAMGGIAGPVVGPVVGGFAAQANGWKWPMYELIWLSSFAFLFLFFLLPETYEPTILLKRAQRLRKLTGNQRLQTLTEKNAELASVAIVLRESLIRPFVLAKEPMLLFANIYLGFVYAVFYLWFEAFPLVFTDIYHFNLGLSGLPFLGFVVTSIATYIVYCLYQMYYVAPLYAKAFSEGKEVPLEMRLHIGLLSSIFIPTSVLIFGFTSKETIHWMVPVIGAALYLPGLYLNFQSILMYMASAYPAYAASVFAGNTLFRSITASVFPLFGRAYFVNLGLGGGSGLLAGISFGLMPMYWSLIKWGHVLRRRSKYATSQ